MALAQLSPHLLGTLKRIFTPSDLVFIENTFMVAIECGGAGEIDFIRAENSSYNPRPARVALILIDQLQEKDSRVVTSALLATIPDLRRELIPATVIDEDILNLSLLSQLSPEELTAQQAHLPAAASKIALAAWLDRIRHFHLAPSETKKTLCMHIALQTDKFLELAQTTNSPLTPFLVRWRDRFYQNSTPQTPDE